MPVRSRGEDVVDEERAASRGVGNRRIDMEARREVVGTGTPIRGAVMEGCVAAVAGLRSKGITGMVGKAVSRQRRSRG